MPQGVAPASCRGVEEVVQKSEALSRGVNSGWEAIRQRTPQGGVRATW